MTAITGNTYPVKDSLKALGARWNADQKAWMVEDSKAEQARKIVAGNSRATAGYGTDGKLHQATATKLANSRARKERHNSYRAYTGREHVCDE
jgi:hypothetical protein